MRDELAAAVAQGVTVTEVRGFCRQKGHPEMYRGTIVETKFNPEVKLDTAVEDSLVDQVVETICNVAHTGQVGDG